MPPAALTKAFGRLARALHAASPDPAPFEAARRAHPGFAHLLRALDHLDRGRLAEARGDARAAGASAAFAVRVLAAQALFLAGARREGLASLDAALAGDAPDASRAAALLVRASFERALGRYDDALASLDAAAPLSPRAVDAWVESAELCATFDWHEEGLRRLEVACSLAPDAPELHRRRALALVALARFDEAAAAAAASLARARDGHEALAAVEALVAAGDLDAAEAALARPPVAPDDPAAALWRGRFALWRGDAPAAREALRGAPPGSPDVARARAAADLLDGAWWEARRGLDALLAAHPEDAEARFLRAEVRLRLGYEVGAREDADRARLQARDHVPGYVVRLRVKLGPSARLSLIHDEAEEVSAALAALLADAPERLADWPTVDADAVDLALRRLGGNRSERATYVDAGGRLRRLALPATARFAMTRAQQRVGLAPTAEVLAALDRLVEEHASVTMPRCYRGEVYLWLGDLARARADFEASIEGSRRTRWAYIGLGAVEMLEGDLAQARRVFERLHIHASPGPTLYVYRAETLRRGGDRDGARRDLDAALAQAPGRLGARVNHALWHLAWGERDVARAEAAALAARAPELFAEVTRALGLPGEPPEAPDALAAVFEASLGRMRGNRSSSIFTWFTAEGRLRRTPPGGAGDAGELRLLRRRVERALGLG